MASARSLPWMRTSAASPPGRPTVSAMTMWSYCSQTQRREQRSGAPMRLSSARPMSSGGARLAGSTSAGRGAAVHGRSYSGEASAKGSMGRSPTTAPSILSTMRPVSVRRPTTAKSRSHFSNTARAKSSLPGRRTMSMRSWLSESIIS